VTAFTNTTGNNVIDGTLGTAAFTATTTPLKCRLMTANGSAASAGTEATGGSYTSQTVTFASASGQSAASNLAATYTGMPAATITGVELWDSAGTPIRKAFGALSANKTTNSGDTFSIASGSLTFAIT
jgi:hypothetical protein